MNTFSFVAACSNSGKTTLIEKIVPLLKARGLRVAVIKHASKGFELDRPGKDSWRFRQAGADTIVLVGGGETAVMKRNVAEPDLEELAHGLDADIVLFEGFRNSAGNRIEVFRSEVSGKRPLCVEDPFFLALVSDRHFDVPVPCFSLDDAQGVADFLMRELRGNSSPS